MPRDRSRSLPWLDADRPEAFLLPDADERPAQQLEHSDERDYGLEPVLGLEDQVEQLDRSLPQPPHDEVELLLEGPCPAADDHWSGRDARKHAVERHYEEPDLQRLLLACCLNRTRRRRECEGLVFDALHQALGHLLVSAVFLEPLATLLFPTEQVCFLLGLRLAGEEADRLQQEEPRRHPEKLSHFLWVGDLT